MNYGKFANFVVKNRYWFLGVFFVFLIASVVLFNFVNVNYDLTKYLPENSTTKVSIETMKEEFGATGTANILVTKVRKDEAQNLAVLIEQADGVSTAVVAQFKFAEGSTTKGCALISVFLEDGDYTQEAQKAMENIDVVMQQNLHDGQQYYPTGTAVTAGASRNSIMGQIPIIMLVAVVIVLLVLTFTTRSWIEPVILLIVIGTAILINMGTNFFLGEISFISNSVSSVLLIALAMDYSIVLVNRFREEREKDPDVENAMKNTIKGSLTTIIASGLTVMAGLVSLVFMDYKIGVDLGLVLTKGVFISLLAVVFLMPAILILFSKVLKKTEHKNFLHGLKKIGTFTKATRFVFPALFLVLIASAFVVQHTGLAFDYEAKFSTPGDKVYEAEQETTMAFGPQNMLVLMVENDINYEKQQTLFENIKNIQTKDGKKLANNEGASSFATTGQNGTSLGDALDAQQLSQNFGIPQTQASTVLTLSGMQYGYADQQNTKVWACNIIKALKTNPLIQSSLSAEQKAQVDVLYAQEQKAESIYLSKNYVRMMFNISASMSDKNAEEYVLLLNDYLKQNGLENKYLMINNTENIIETNDVFVVDRLKVELISALAVLIIVCLAFRSISLPVLLVLVIEGSIWINLASNALLGNSIFFICYLLGTAIQMGATIDYGILLCDRYIQARKTQNKFEAIKTAIDKSFATILSSGSILTLAALSIGIFSSVPLLSSIGYLIGFGALCASLCILFVLPQIVILFDKVISKTTLHSNFCSNKALKLESQTVETTATQFENVENTKNKKSTKKQEKTVDKNKTTQSTKKRGRTKKIKISDYK